MTRLLPSAPPAAYRATWRRRAVSSLFLLAYAALSILFVVALGVVTTAAVG